MNISKNGKDLIKQFEGFRGTAYLCPANVWTIGWGTTRYPSGKAVQKDEICTQAQAELFLANDLARFEANVMSFSHIYRYNQNQFDALVSFAYNLGSINQLVQNGVRTIAQIADAMLLYNKAGGKVLAGLVRRRVAERELFLKPISGMPVNAPDLSAAERNPFAMPATVIRRTSSSDSVRWLQWQLNKFGYCLAVDGLWGAKTEAAVVDFQKKNKLTIDSLVGPATKAKLIA
jgi:GH24 family phage-related lysozyme (muramidase)